MTSAEEDVDEVVPLLVVALDNGVQLLHLLENTGIVGGEVASQFAKNVDGLLSLSVGNEPSSIGQCSLP